MANININDAATKLTNIALTLTDGTAIVLTEKELEIYNHGIYDGFKKGRYKKIIESHETYNIIEEYMIPFPTENEILEKKWKIAESKPDSIYICISEEIEKYLKLGIKYFFPANENDKICSIGYNPTEKKWFGWSHRAIFSFGIGSTVKKGDCAYIPKNQDDYISSVLEFWKEDYKQGYEVIIKKHEETGKEGFQINWKYKNNTPNKKLPGTISGIWTDFPEKYGRGEWTAETLEDAKQMAIDFADGVS